MSGELGGPGGEAPGSGHSLQGGSGGRSPPVYKCTAPQRGSGGLSPVW